MTNQAPADPPEQRGILSRAWVDCLKAISAAPDAAAALAKSGLATLQSTVGSIRIFSSTRVSAAAENPPQDETHYFLIPSPAEGLVLAERRRLPEGVGTVNSLPKVRLFHVHDPAAVAVLEEKLLGRMAGDRMEGPGLDADLANRLEEVGEIIDRQSFWVTGGLVVIGGAVAIANPLLGVGIAANALLPDIGAKLTKLGLGTVADQLRRIGQSRREKTARKEASDEIRRLKPQVVTDPVLTFLDRLVALGPKADAQLGELERIPEWWRNRDQRFALGVVCDVLKDSDPWPAWLASVRRRLAEFQG